jgi:hypothetical protein
MTLLVVPVVLGQGKRLFPEEGPDATLEVIRSHTDARGVGVHVYRPAGRNSGVPPGATELDGNGSEERRSMVDS